MREDRRAICQINYVRKNKKNINEKKNLDIRSIDLFLMTFELTI